MRGDRVAAIRRTVKGASVLHWGILATVNIASDGGWPSGFAVQARIPNHRKLRRSRAVVVSVPGKGPARPGQVSCKKRTARKPLLKCRNLLDDVKTAA